MHHPLGHESHLSHNPQRQRVAPRIVMVMEGMPNAAELKSFFLARGFEVKLAKNSGDARRVARDKQTVASIVAVDSGKLESGWLTCKKMLLERPSLRVVLVGNKPSAKAERFAHFLGASAYISTSSSPHAIARAALGGELPSMN